MDVMEHQLTTTIDGVECPISPKTDTSTVHTKYDKTLEQVLDEQIPVRLTYQEYLNKIKSGEITDEDKTYYHIIDDVDGVGISDSTVSRNTTFSSKKILELVTTQGGPLSGSGSSMTMYTKTIQPSNWSSNTPSTASITIPGISNDSLVLVALSNNLTGEEYLKQSDVVNSAKIIRIKHTDNILTLYAYGVTPTIPIQLEISTIK